jgi:hypothetical protein
MKITITAREAFDKGIWEELCALNGYNVWCVSKKVECP